MDCSSKKNQYYTEEEAMEALVLSQIRYNNPANSYYLCSECAQFHLTSREPMHPMLKRTEITERIRKEQQSQDWSQRLRRK